jgi:hypothetical protein
METESVRLLDALDWHGPALLEFKRRPDGTYVLMEINPKFWASYALASHTGYRFASAIATRALDLPSPEPAGAPNAGGEMVFPLQELYYAATTPDESVLGSLAAMFWPPAAVDVNLRDLGAWLSPPARFRNGGGTEDGAGHERGTGDLDPAAYPGEPSLAGEVESDVADLGN